MPGRQAKRAAVKVASVISRSHAAKARKPSPLKAAVILPTTKANQTSIAKTQIVRQLPQAGRIVPKEAIVRTAVAGIAGIAGGVGAAGIAEVAVVAPGGAIVGLVVAEIEAVTARTAIGN